MNAQQRLEHNLKVYFQDVDENDGYNTNWRGFKYLLGGVELVVTEPFPEEVDVYDCIIDWHVESSQNGRSFGIRYEWEFFDDLVRSLIEDRKRLLNLLHERVEIMLGNEV